MRRHSRFADAVDIGLLRLAIQHTAKSASIVAESKNRGRNIEVTTKLLRRLHLVALFLFVGPGPVRADDNYYDCEVVEHLRLTKEGYRHYPTPDPILGRHLIIDKQSGEVRGPLPNLEWQRIRVVKVSPDYNVFMTRGYGFDGTPVKEVIVSLLSGQTQFVSIDVLTDMEILNGTCK